MSKPNFNHTILLTSSARLGLGLCALLTGCADVDGRGDGGEPFDGSMTDGADDGSFDDEGGTGTGEGADESAGDMPPEPGVCGDGVVDPAEDCDDGINDGSYGSCNDDCTHAAHCGDGLRNGVDEICDDGNADAADGCLADCSIPSSCLDIKSLDGDAEDGSYIIDPDGEDGEPELLVYCDMSTLVVEWGESHETADDFGHHTAGADVAIGEVGVGQAPDMVLLHIDDPSGDDHGYFQIGWDLDDAGDPTHGWTEPRPIPGGFGHHSSGAGLSLADIDGNGVLDLIVSHIDDPFGDDRGYYRIGWNLDQVGHVTGGWTGPIEVPGEYSRDTAEAGVTVVDLDDNGAQELIMFHVQDQDGEDQGYYQIGWDLDASGEASLWSSMSLVPGGFGSHAAGAGITAIRTAPEAPPSLVVFHLDDSLGDNRGYYRVGRRLDATGTVSEGWSDPVELSGSWGSKSRYGGVAGWDLGEDGSLDLLFFHIDDPLGANPGFYQWGFTL